MNKKYISILVLVILIPRVALAAWYNPLSWSWVKSVFNKEIIVEQPVEILTPEPVSVTTTSTPATTTTQIKPADTEEVSEMDTLKKEIADLKKEVQTAKQQNQVAAPVVAQPIYTPPVQNIPVQSSPAPIPTVKIQPVKVPPPDPQKEYEVSQIISYCNMVDFKKICVEKNVLGLVNTFTPENRKLLIQKFADSVAKNQQILNQLKAKADASARAAAHTNLPPSTNLDQDSFNRDVCEKAGGTYFGGKCI